MFRDLYPVPIIASALPSLMGWHLHSQPAGRKKSLILWLDAHQ